MDSIEGVSFLKLVRIEALTRRFREGMGEDTGLLAVVTCVEMLGAVQELPLRHGFIENAAVASLLGLTRCTSRSKLCPVGGGVNKGAAREKGGRKDAVVCATVDALVMNSLSSDSDMRSSSETVVVALESVGEEHHELLRTSDIFDCTDACMGKPS